MKLLFLTLTATALLSSPATSQDKGPSDRIKALQKQRIDTLKQATEIGLKLYQSGRIEVAEVLEDRLALLKAELEAAPKTEHIPFYTLAIDSLKQYEEIAKARFDHGRGTEYAMLRVRAKRLEVEVLLEKAKGSKAGKDASWSAPADGIRARLTSAKARYKVGEPLRLTLELEEAAGKARSLEAPRFLPMISYPDSHPYGADHGFPWVVTCDREGGNPQIQWDRRAASDSIEARVKLPSRGTHQVEISAMPPQVEAERERREGDQRETLHFVASEEPGVYLLRATYTRPRERTRPVSAAWQATHLQTPPVRIEIVR